MKSLQILRYSDEEKARFTHLQVMRSAAGFYVGSSYMEVWGETPGTRDSDYFPTAEEAAEFLERVKAGDLKANSALRLEP